MCIQIVGSRKIKMVNELNWTKRNARQDQLVGNHVLGVSFVVSVSVEMHQVRENIVHDITGNQNM